METPKEITDVLKKLHELSGQAFKYFEVEADYAQRIKWDLANLNNEKCRIAKEIEEMKAEKDVMKQAGAEMLAKAKEKADNIVRVAERRNAETLVLLEKVKEFVDEHEKKTYMALKETLV